MILPNPHRGEVSVDLLARILRQAGITREEWEWLLDGYYDERGWDLERGWPTRERLTELGLRDIADDLVKNGYPLKDKTEPISRANPWDRHEVGDKANI